MGRRRALPARRAALTLIVTLSLPAWNVSTAHMLPLDLQPVQSVRQAMQTQTWIRRRSATRVRPADTRRRVPLFVCSVQLARQIMTVIQELRACRASVAVTALLESLLVQTARLDSLTWIQIPPLAVIYVAPASSPMLRKFPALPACLVKLIWI